MQRSRSGPLSWGCGDPYPTPSSEARRSHVCHRAKFSVGPVSLEELLSSNPEPRRGPRLGGVALTGAVPFATSLGDRPLAEAILYRVFKEISAEIVSENFRAISRLARELLGDFLSESDPMSTWEWLVSMTKARRRKELIRAYHRYLERGQRSKDFAVFKAFVKSELLPWFSQSPEGPDNRHTRYVARLIQAPHDETHLLAGPWLKPLVYKLKQVWSSGNWIFYASVKPSEIDTWLMRNRHATSWFWSDYKAFDATYSSYAWEMLEGFYRQIYPLAPVDFWDVLEIWRCPHGKMRNRKSGVTIEYFSDACNASGRDDTALANALFNGLVLAVSFAAAICGKAIADLTAEDLCATREMVQIAVVGDDSLVACMFDVRPFQALVEANIRSFGLVVEAQSSLELVDVTFLGMMPYPVGDALFWGPTIGRRLYKAFWQLDPVGNLPAWTKGVAEQLAQYQCVPVLCDLAERVLELLSRRSVQHVLDDPDKLWYRRDSPTPRWDNSTLAWLERRYCRHGLSKHQIMRDLDVIRTIERLPAVVHLYTADAAIATDDL